jgi:hypothetical protein
VFTWVQLVPGAPTSVVAFPGNGQGELAWAAPTYTGTSPIDFYYIAAYPNNGGNPVLIDINCGLYCTTGVVPWLTNGVAWTFTINAHNASGYSAAGATTTSVTPSANPPPYPPTGALASAGNADAYVTWTAPPANGGGALSGYIVFASDDSTGSYVSAGYQFVAPGTTSVVFGGLTNGHPYAFAVYSYNAAGNAVTPDGGITANITPTATPAPFPVTSATAAAGDTTALVSWNPPASGAPPTSYVVFEDTFVNNVATEVADAVVTAPLTVALFTGLTDGTPYVYVVYAGNANGYSQAAITALATPQSILGAVLNPSNTVAVPADKTAVVTWTAPLVATALTTTYTVDVYQSPAGGGNTGGTLVTADNVGYPSAACSTGSTSDPPTVGPLGPPCAVISGLKNGTSYYFAVLAYTLGIQTGASGSSPAVTPASRPFPPAITTVANVAPAGGVAQVTWNSPPTQPDGTPGNNGSPILAYTLTATPTTGANPPNPNATVVSSTYNTTTPDPASHTTTLAGLYNGTTYSVAVTAINAIGASDPSNTISLMPFGTPHPPTNVSPTLDTGGTGASVSWSPPPPQSNGVPGDNGSPILSYTVTANNSDANPIQSHTVSGSTFSSDFQNLPPGTYTFDVYATNSAGNGNLSGESISIMISGVPDAPPNAQVAINGTTATVAWTAPESNGSPIQYYTVTPSPESPAVQAVTLGPNVTSAQIEDLEVGTQYVYYITATNASGTGPPAVAGDNAPTPVSYSHYITDSDVQGAQLGCSPCSGTAYDTGHVDGVRAANAAGSKAMYFLEYLDFNHVQGGGDPTKYGGLEFVLNGDLPSTLYSLPQVQATVYEYLAGWYAGAQSVTSTANAHVRVEMSINNSGLCESGGTIQLMTVCDPYQAGGLYAYALSDLVMTVDANGWASQVYLWASSDTETDPAAYSSWARTQPFEDGYLCVNDTAYGSAIDLTQCPAFAGTFNVGTGLYAEFFDQGAGQPNFGPNTDGRGGDQGWTQQHLYGYVATAGFTGAGEANPPHPFGDGLALTPEEYLPGDITGSWDNVMESVRHAIPYRGILSDYPDMISGQKTLDSETALRDAISETTYVDETQDIYFQTDISGQNPA